MCQERRQIQNSHRERCDWATVAVDSASTGDWRRRRFLCCCMLDVVAIERLPSYDSAGLSVVRWSPDALHLSAHCFLLCLLDEASGVFRSLTTCDGSGPSSSICCFYGKSRLFLQTVRCAQRGNASLGIQCPLKTMWTLIAFTTTKSCVTRLVTAISIAHSRP